MKQIKKQHPGGYISPVTILLDVCFEGTLCESTLTQDQGQLEGYGTEDEFSGWGN